MSDIQEYQLRLYNHSSSITQNKLLLTETDVSLFTKLKSSTLEFSPILNNNR